MALRRNGGNANKGFSEWQASCGSPRVFIVGLMTQPNLRELEDRQIRYDKRRKYGFGGALAAKENQVAVPRLRSISFNFACVDISSLAEKA